MTRGSTVFLDTNILLAATDRSRPEHQDCRSFVRDAGSVGISPTVCGQGIREYLGVAIRPATSNGLGLSTRDALHNVDTFLTRLVLLPEPVELVRIVLSLVAEHSIDGEHVHDVNIAATMVRHGINEIVTSNLRDFEVFSGLTVHSPSEAVTALRRVGD